MIASLRNGLADGITVTRHRHAAVRYGPRHLHMSSRTPHGLAWRVSGSLALYPPHGSRFLATGPPPAAQTQPAKDIAPTISSGSARKPKVDLRPGPVKPPKASEPSAVPPPTASLESTSKPTTSSSSSADASISHEKTSSGNLVIQTAKEDLQDASQHGILAPPPEGASWIGKLYHQGKELFKFYWNGVKLINTNRRRVRDIEARIKAGGAPLTRWESRFIATYKLDALKLIPFALIIIIAEEAIPLVVIYAPFLLPSTCLLPSQKERIVAKRREKQKMWAENMASVFQEVHSRALVEPEASVNTLLTGPSAALSYTGLLSLSTFGPPPMRIRRVKKHLNGLVADDALLAGENLGERLTALELREALEERGIVAEGLTTDEMRMRLEWWLEKVGQAGGEDAIRRRVVLVAANAIGKHD